MPNIDKSLQPLQYIARETVFGIQSAYRETAVERALYRVLHSLSAGAGCILSCFGFLRRIGYMADSAIRRGAIPRATVRTMLF